MKVPLVATAVVAALILTLLIIDQWWTPIPVVRKARKALLGVLGLLVVGFLWLVGKQPKPRRDEQTTPKLDPIEHENTGDGLNDDLEDTQEALDAEHPTETDPEDFPSDDPDDLATADEWARRRRSSTDD